MSCEFANQQLHQITSLCPFSPLILLKALQYLLKATAFDLAPAESRVDLLNLSIGGALQLHAAKHRAQDVRELPSALETLLSLNQLTEEISVTRTAAAVGLRSVMRGAGGRVRCSDAAGCQRCSPEKVPRRWRHTLGKDGAAGRYDETVWRALEFLVLCLRLRLLLKKKNEKRTHYRNGRL